MLKQNHVNGLTKKTINKSDICGRASKFYQDINQLDSYQLNQREIKSFGTLTSIVRSKEDKDFPC